MTVAFSRRAAVFLLSAALAPIPTLAQFPERPVHLIVNTAPGGTADALARLIGEELASTWSKAVIIDNKPGGSGVVGTDALAKAAADGYTLGLFGSSHALNTVLGRKLPYDTERDFKPIGLLATAPGLLVVHPGVPATDVKTAFDLAKANPGKYSFASPVPLSAGHRAMELLKHMSGADIRHIPYKSGAQAVTDTVGGHVQFLVAAIPSLLGQVKTGKLRPLAVTGLQRFEGLPDIPTVAESLFPGFESVEWYGIYAPVSVPAAVTAKTIADLRAILQQPRVRQRIADLGVLPGDAGGPDELDAKFKTERARWAQLAPTIGLRAD